MEVRLYAHAEGKSRKVGGGRREEQRWRGCVGCTISIEPNWRDSKSPFSLQQQQKRLLSSHPIAISLPNPHTSTAFESNLPIKSQKTSPQLPPMNPSRMGMLRSQMISRSAVPFHSLPAVLPPTCPYASFPAFHRSPFFRNFF